MITLKNTLSFIGFILVCIVLYAVFFKTPSKPWEDSGRFVLAIRSVPGLTSENVLGVGIDNFELNRIDGKTEKVSVLTRRITLNPKNTVLEIVLDTYVPVGDYSGFSFVLKSPELRNEWQEDEAPDRVALVNESVRLNVPYTILKDVTSSVILSFETLSAIHEDGNEKKYLPVIQVETRGNTTITGGENEPVAIQGGDILHSATFGMDWNGEMRYNFRAKKKVPENTEILPVLEEEHNEITATGTEQILNETSTSGDVRIDTELDTSTIN